MTTTATNEESRVKKRKHKCITRLACWNVTSWNGRDQEIMIEMKNHQIDICALSETKKKGQGTSTYGNYTLIYSGKPKQERAHSGVGILLHNKYLQNIQDIQYINDRILKTTLNMNNITTHLISTYAPDITKSPEEKELFYQQLQETVDRLHASDKVIILGDLNARIGNDIIQGVKQKFNETTLNENGELLIDFCSANEMRINNTYFPHKEQHKYTFNNNKGQRSMIDYIITNRKILPSQILDTRALTSANIGTDHSLVLCKILLERPRPVKKPPKLIEKYNLESFTSESTKHLYESRIKTKLNNTNPDKEANVDATWQNIGKCINEAAKESIGERKVNINATRNTKAWFCEEVRNLADQKKKSYQSYRSTPTTESLAEYHRVRNEVNSRIKAIKREHWSKFTSDMDYDLYGAQKKIWKMLRNQKKPLSEYIQTKAVSKEDWETYFKQLYSTKEVEYLDKTVNTRTTIRIEEVREKLGKLKNRKSPGTDNIPNELLKYGGVELTEELTKLFNKIICRCDIPTEWHNSVTIPIFKKGEKNSPENYRGITLLNTSMKLFTSVIKSKLEEVITNAEEQQGFRTGRSITDAAFVVKQIKEKSIEFNTPAYMCFVDLTKAFDRVRLGDVLDLLAQRGVPADIINIVHKLNSNNTTKVRTGDELTESIPTPGGIRQGDSLSPFLFNLLMDKIIEEVAALNLGYTMGRKRICMICYADDAAIVANSEDDLQRELHRFYQVSEGLNMIISTAKTKCMVVSREATRCKLVVNNTPIEQVMDFSYLGVRISSSHDPVKDLRSQINKASAVSGCLRTTVWSNKFMRMESKLRIYKTCIRPIMTYGIEIREDTNKTKSMLRVAEMKTLRAAAGKTRWDRIKNSDIRDQCGVQDIVRWGRQRKRQWHNHVRRMPEDRLPKIALTNNPPGARPPGRPPKRWRDSWQSTSQEMLPRQNHHSDVTDQQV